MSLLNLDKIVLHRTVMGVSCPVCGGLLEVRLGKPGWLSRMIRRKEKKITRYRCLDCGRRYKMLEEL